MKEDESPAKEYKALAIDYDLLNPKEEIFKQKDFFKRLIDKHSIKSCLDCACGTGWHLHMLQKMGIESYGSDLSPEMLKQARKNMESVTVKLKSGDFRTLENSWNRQFDMIICMTTSFPHMATDGDAIKALQSIYGRLNEGGILVIDSGITDSMLDSKPKFIKAREFENGSFYFVLEYPNSDQVIFNILEIKKSDSSLEHAFESITYNAMRKSKLEGYFAQTDFKDIEYFGGFDLSPYSENESGRLITIAHK